MTITLVNPTPDCPLVTRFEPSMGYACGLYSVRTKPRKAAAIVIHGTGYGPVRRWQQKPDKFETVFDAALWIYQHLCKSSPHYLIGPGGFRLNQVAQLVPEAYRAWHVKTKGSKRYRKRWHRQGYGWWRVRWHPHTSPLELGKGEIWANGSCNDNTIAVEFVPDPADPYGKLTEDHWSSLIALARDIRRRRQIPLHPERILTHSDVHPIDRTAKGLPYDLRLDAWTWDEFKRRIGV